MATNASATFTALNETNYKTLLGLVEFFRLSQPPRLRETIHCLQATLSIEGLPQIEKARCRLNLAKLLLQHTRNVGHARGHLEEAHQISSYIKDIESDKIFFESTSTLATVYSEQNQGTLAKKILQKSLERSGTSPLKNWHYRLIFQLSEAHAHDKEFSVAIELLSALGEIRATENNHQYVRLLYMLSKCLLLLANKELPKFEQSLNQAEGVKKDFVARTNSIQRCETVKIFSGFLKLYYYIVTGRPKTGKEDLKELQKSIQLLAATPDEVTSPDDPEAFHWMPKDHLCILVYLVTVMHSMHSGLMARAIRHTEKALALIEKTKAVGNDNQMTLIFNLSLLEHAVMCKIVQGQGAQAIQEVEKACKICSLDPKLMTLMKPVIHALLGLYGMSMNLMADAEEQFKRALSLSNNQCDVYSLAALNLAIIYVREGPARYMQLRQLLEGVDSDSVVRSKNLHSSYFYMMGLKTFFSSKYDDSRKFLQESIRIANTEDLNRMTACALILLGHVVTSLQNPQEAVGLVVPAMQVANKIPDVYLQLWASSLMKDIYHMLGDVNHEREGGQLHNMYTTQLLHDHFTAGQRPEHALLKDFR
ncbi:MAU2 chromatid cohesion factor homolog [Hydractinia symbiolongicarpus]|uniref:MAU2 chromatid cohesion factor homolog n=1 Tax=Hydractinia symbiolongicarpus TaxID=13093 RepID=UPI002550EAB3|nr:MAU2 chromatid cohesion factor homolog [Hydractinia symbiolongicarpus]